LKDQQLAGIGRKDISLLDIELLRKALDASYSGIILTDHTLEDNPIIYCNAAFEKMSGYSRNEIIGHNCRFLQGEDRNEEARLKLKEYPDRRKLCGRNQELQQKRGTILE
jgi:PAS domain S-box-containing protein